MNNKNKYIIGWYVLSLLNLIMYYITTDNEYYTAFYGCMILAGIQQVIQKLNNK